jgi:hypothetical protein
MYVSVKWLARLLRTREVPEPISARRQYILTKIFMEFHSP